MRNPRTKQNDWSKAFKVVFGRKQFELLQVNEGDNSATTVCDTNKKQTHQDKKQQIVVPKIEIVKRITDVKKFSGVPFNYLRVRQQLNLPKLIAYELNQVDHTFLKTNQHKYMFKGKKVLTAKFMEKAFIELESKLGKQTSIPKAKTWMLSFIEKEYKELLEMENLHQFAQLFYSYWRNRRQDLRFPLLRPLWRPNPDEFNHLLAFKVREKQKRNLRRGNRINDDQIGTQLADEFQNAILLSERIMARQQTKYQQLKIQILQFHTQIKSQMSSSQNKQFLSMLGQDQMKKQKITQRLQSNKDRLKRFQKDIDFFKKKKQVNEEQQYSFGQEKVLNIVDNRQSAINFLATIINYAQSFGVSYESIFHQSQSTYVPINHQTFKQTYSPPQLIPVRSATCVNIAPAIDDQPAPIQQKGQYLTYELYLQNNTKSLIRKFTDINQGFLLDPQKHHEKPRNNLNKSYLQQKSNCITKYYFGDDDEGDYKDLKKNISVSFKKFMQITKNGQ